jgi:hypothetical protein
LLEVVAIGRKNAGKDPDSMGTDWLNINSTWIHVIGQRIFSWILQLAQNVLHMETCVVGSIEQHMDRIIVHVIGSLISSWYL